MEVLSAVPHPPHRGFPTNTPFKRTTPLKSSPGDKLLQTLRVHYLHFMFLNLLPASVIWATRNICKIPEGCQDLEEHSCKSLQHRHHIWRAFEIKWRCEVWLFAHSPPHFSSWVGNLSFSCIPDRCSIHQDELRNGKTRKQENTYLALILWN